jgi:Flp pilus assembly pilin Flp
MAGRITCLVSALAGLYMAAAPGLSQTSKVRPIWIGATFSIDTSCLMFAAISKSYRQGQICALTGSSLAVAVYCRQLRVLVIVERLPHLLSWNAHAGDCSMQDRQQASPELHSQVTVPASANFQQYENGGPSAAPAPAWFPEFPPRRGAMKNFAKTLEDDRAQDVAEYAVMIAVILVIVIGLIRLIGFNSSTVFSNVASSIQ